MRKGSINIFELHIEKAVLGLAGAFMIYMVVAYLLGSPNVVEYRNQEVGPDQLDAEILASAEGLDQQIARAMDGYEPESVENTSDELKQRFAAGLLDDQPDTEPAVPATLRRSVPWGPQLSAEEAKPDTSRGAVVLVTPQAPTRPVVQTGRCRAVLEPYVLSAEEDSRATAAAEEPDVSEISWVTVAAYWDLDAQRARQIEAGYSPGTARPYFAGTAVERQELLPTGEWSQWEAVKPGLVMPQVKIPKPEYDELSGRIINKGAIGAMFTEIQGEQLELAQPRFPVIERGDAWFIPPLEGYTEEDRKRKLAAIKREQEKKEDDTLAARDDRPKDRDRGRGGGGGIMMSGGGGDDRRDRPGGRGMTGPGGRPGGAREDDNGPSKADIRKQSQLDYLAAKTAFLDHNYAEAKQLAEKITEDDDVKGRVKNDAKSLLERAESMLELAEYNGLERGSSLRSEGPTVVTNPDSEHKHEFAVWLHDDTVTPGKAYRYRLRVDLWNRYVSRPEKLANPEDARRVVLESEWSEPSDPITAAPRTQFFVTRGQPGKETVRVDVWKWHDGWWVGKDFEVGIGEEIGGPATIQSDELDENDRPKREEIDFSTGAVVLDIRYDEPTATRLDAGRQGFKYTTKDTVVLVYVDPADGRVREADLLNDSFDPDYKRLKDWFQ